MFRYALSWAGIFAGLALKDFETVDNLAPLIFPFTMIANTFVPTSHMVAWLRTVADWNPISAVTAAARQLFGNPGAGMPAPAWPLQHPVFASVAWSTLLLAVFIPLAIRRYMSST